MLKVPALCREGCAAYEGTTADKVEEMMKSGTMEELPMVAAPGDSADLVRIHGKKNPKVHVETCGCQMNTKNTTGRRALLVTADEPSASRRVLSHCY